MQQNNHPLFMEVPKIHQHVPLQVSLRNDGVPLVIQQQSLAQNTQFYTRGTHDMATKTT